MLNKTFVMRPVTSFILVTFIMTSAMGEDKGDPILTKTATVQAEPLPLATNKREDPPPQDVVMKQYAIKPETPKLAEIFGKVAVKPKQAIARKRSVEYTPTDWKALARIVSFRPTSDDSVGKANVKLSHGGWR